jgi:hypothetical protein
MQTPTETCIRCQKVRGSEDTTHASYCRACWREMQRGYREKNGPRAPAATCSRCKEPKTDGSHPAYCRACWAAMRVEKRKKDGPDPYSKRCSRCGNPRAAEDRTHASYCQQCFRAYLRMRQYGITQEQYDARLAAQGGRCAICRNGPEQSRFGILAVDHCHDKGHVRGLLCDRCNMLLGRWKHDPALLRHAADYLEAPAS